MGSSRLTPIRNGLGHAHHLVTMARGNLERIESGNGRLDLTPSQRILAAIAELSDVEAHLLRLGAHVRRLDDADIVGNS